MTICGRTKNVWESYEGFFSGNEGKGQPYLYNNGASMNVFSGEQNCEAFTSINALAMNTSGPGMLNSWPGPDGDQRCIFM